MSKKAAADHQRETMKELLYTISKRVTVDGNLVSLAKELGRPKRRMSVWISKGRVPLSDAIRLLQMTHINPRHLKKITLEDLTAPELA